MLFVLNEEKVKRKYQSALRKKLSNSLIISGSRKIGIRGGSEQLPIFSAGDLRLWCAFKYIDDEGQTPRFWNAFGIYNPDKAAQQITVEINIATDDNSERVAGFFAQDSNSKDIFLMHNGGVGGGRSGVGKSAFLLHSKVKLFDVRGEDGTARKGIPIAKLSDPDLVGRVESFVRKVADFKDAVTAGYLDNDNFKIKVQNFDQYRKEFSGKKGTKERSETEFIAYHGDIVDAAHKWLNNNKSANEAVFNTQLIDLLVKEDDQVKEIYESRQASEDSSCTLPSARF